LSLRHCPVPETRLFGASKAPEDTD
jgi:hypothetical protein